MECSLVFLTGSPDCIGEGVSYYCAVGGTADVRQEQGEAAGYFRRTGPSGGPRFRWELTRRGLLDRLGQSSNAHRAENPYDGGEKDGPVGFGGGPKSP